MLRWNYYSVLSYRGRAASMDVFESEAVVSPRRICTCLQGDESRQEKYDAVHAGEEPSTVKACSAAGVASDLDDVLRRLRQEMDNQEEQIPCPQQLIPRK